MPRRAVRSKPRKTAKAYDHKETDAVLRPDIGIQAQFKKKKAPAKYRYDRSLDPQLSWDINADREYAALIEKVRGAKSIEDALRLLRTLKRISSPIPYFHNGQMDDFVPDYLVRLGNNGEELWVR